MKQAESRTYPGVFLIALSLLMLEVTLTRIFSVVLFYHFAVLSISLALFGAATAGVVVYLFPKYFQKESFATTLTNLSLIYSISIVVSFVIFLRLPAGARDVSVDNFIVLLLAYVILALPFFYGGLVLSLVLKRMASQVSLIYFADLLGAASGCLLALWSLDVVGGPGTIFVAAVVGALASLAFNTKRQSRLWYGNLAWLGLSVVVLILGVQSDVFRIKIMKGGVEPDPLYERWNSFSRVTVYPENKQDGQVFGWGLSHNAVYDNPGWMRLAIDAMAETPIIHFDGNWESVRFLKYDVSALVYYLKDNAKVFVIGPGGGRDVLSALMFGAYQVDGVELNPLIVQAVRDNFADYSGRIYEDPRVNIHADDGRNFLAKSSERYDVIQASAVDTWAATAAGAFALSENTLYTQEAFHLYRQHLTPEGILAFSRFIYPGDHYGEALRLTSLALAAWEADGVQKPNQNLIVVGNLNAEEDEGYVSLLLKNAPFTLAEVEQVEAVSQELGFSVLYAPFGRGYGVMRELVTAPDYEAFWENYAIDISPPTDDRPFFFQMIKLTDIPRLGFQTIFEGEQLRFIPIATLGILLTLVSLLVLIFILGPMWLYKRRAMKEISGNSLFLIYFACLGIAFMLIEVGLIQKFVLFLGHPTYSLAVVLSSLLLSSGLGSFFTRRVAPERAAQVASRIGVGLIFLVPLYIYLLPILHGRFMGLDQPLKIMISLGGLFPIGLAMGTFFPLGIKITVVHQAETAIPWYWAVNGATSVFATVFAIAVGLQFGIRAELMGGWLVYLIATGILFIFVVQTREVTYT